MPGRNVPLGNGEFYHVYNRGSDKRNIFIQPRDYKRFQQTFYYYQFLGPKPKFSNFAKSKLDNFKSLPDSELIEIICYCLMPNHFHFLIKQKNPNSIDKFMNSLMTRYTMYFNKKYKRVGSLYQGVYNAVLVFTDEQLLNLSRYIHKQALSIPSLTGSGQPSSYTIFTGSEKSEWVYPEEILSYLSKEYPKFTYKTLLNEESDWDLIHNFTLEE
ncbi:MAG: transposase [Candidatus Daviesbacteria bacterium]|nr:transposase [Candidatus Daviesbacteria bacterium]